MDKYHVTIPAYKARISAFSILSAIATQLELCLNNNYVMHIAR